MQINFIETPQALAPTQINLGDYVINPYRGCSLGCIYCYVRQNKTIKKRRENWGKFLDVKINISEVLVKELKIKKPKIVLLGSTTECFQPQEETFGLTKAILRILKEDRIPVVVLTKSILIEKYLDELNYHPGNKIYFTFSFAQKKIKKLLEPCTPCLSRRVRTIKTLLEKGLQVKIHIGPFIPYLDSIESLLALLPSETKEIELELYNARMGNFPELLSIISSNLGETLKKKIERIYSNEKNYNLECRKIKDEAERINKNYGYKLDFIFPEFNSWYTEKIRYK